MHSFIFISFDSKRGGEFESSALQQHRADSLHEIALKSGTSRANQLLHKHPIEIGAANLRHAAAMQFIDEQHTAELAAMKREHDIALASQDAHNPALKSQSEALQLREWHLSAMDATNTEHNLAQLQKLKDNASAREQSVRTDEVRRLTDAQTNQQREHLAAMERIQLDHRARTMRADEDRVMLEHNRSVGAISQAHQERMSELKAADDHGKAELEHQHQRRMLDVKLQSSCQPWSAPNVSADGAVVGPLGPGPDRGFGVGTQELLWSLGMPDGYSEKHNLHKKLETAIRCLVAEQPSDPCSRLAQLMM